MLRTTKSKTNTNGKHKRVRRKRLGLETLESRRLLAGDVTAEVVDGNLLLRGDQLSNQIELRAAADGTAAIEIVGLPGEDGDLTTINGASSYVFDGVTGDISASMRGGDDVIYIHDLDLPGDLNVRTGRGNDRVLVGGLPRDAGPIVAPLPDEAVDEAFASADLVAPGEPVDIVPILPRPNVTIAGQARIVTGAGNDAVVMGSLEVYDNMTINSGRHGDVIRLGINELQVPTDGELLGDIAFVEDGPPINLPLDVFGSLRINTGGGDDQAWLESVHVAQNMRVNLGGGSDIFSYDWGGVAGRISVDGGSGDDLVALVHVAADTVRIRTRGGDDGVGLVGVNARRLNVHLGGGDDQMLLADTTASTARFHGGGGTDAFMLAGVNDISRLRLLSFEIIS
jgi:hypothetical protein